MMELKEPKRKRRVPPILQQPFPIPIGGISAITAGHWQFYYGMYLGDCVVIEDPDDMAAVYNKGFFGKSSLSRDMPKFQKRAEKTPIFIRERQWKRRCTWAKKQQMMVSNLQYMFTQGSGSNTLEKVSRTPLKDQFHNSLKESGKEDVNISEKTAANCEIVVIDEADKHERVTEHNTTNTVANKPVIKTELVELESKNQIKEAAKSSTGKSYDVILLDSEDEAVSVVDETRISSAINTSENQNDAPASNVSHSKLNSEKEVASGDSKDDSIVLNHSEEKVEILRDEKNNKVLDAMCIDSGNDSKRKSVMDCDTVPQKKSRRMSDKDKVEIAEANLNKPETAVENSHSSREDEVILIETEECSNGVEGEVVTKQTEIEVNKNANESNKQDASEEVSQPNGGSVTTENSESKNDKNIELDRSQDSLTETKVSPPNKNIEVIILGDSSTKPACEPKLSVKDEDSNTMEVNEVPHVVESETSNVIATEAQEENISDSEKTKSMDSSTDATVHMEVENSDNITKDVDEHKTKAHKDNNKNGIVNGDEEDLVLVLSDGDSDSEEFLKNLNPRLEKEMFAVRETLQLMLEEAFFLSFGLGCLQVVDICGNILSLTQMWQIFRKSDVNFTSKYVAYHYFRSKGWVVKPGIKFGGDFLLYKQGPAFYHSSYIVIVETVDVTSRTPDDKVSKSFSWTRLHGLVRLAESAGKEILLCHVIQPPDVTRESMDSPSIISKFKVHEQLVTRWVSSEEREDGDSSE